MADNGSVTNGSVTGGSATGGSATSGSTTNGSATGGRADSINPALWGRPCWDTMHYFAAGYPLAPTPADQDAARQFYTSLVRMLPCADCRDHGSAYVAAKPPPTTDRDSLFRWTVEYRNAVNVRVGAPQVPLARAQVQYLQARLDDQGAPPVEAVVKPAFDPEASRRAMGLNAAPQPAVSAPRRFGMMPSHVVSRAPAVARAPVVSRAPPGARAPAAVSRAPVAAPRGPPGAARNPVRAPARKKCNCGR
jgi:FAD-linked sulfhydryl oxidase